MLASDIIKKIRRIEIKTRKMVDQLTGGAYKSVFKGQGMEFLEVREYTEGDDIRSIDWNVTARTGHAFIKKMVEEREMIVFLLVDISASGDFGTKTGTKKELIAELAALFAFSAIRNNDQVGMILFTDKKELFIPPKKGKSHVLRIIRELLAHENLSKKTDISHALKEFNHVQKKKAVCFLISDFLEEKNYQHLLKITGKHHDLTMINISDPAEKVLPKSPLIAFEDAENGEIMYGENNKKFSEKYKETTAFFNEKLQENARQAGCDLINIQTGEDYIKPIMTFFKKRERKRH